nr:unnamed protein product [Callosobruchus analis]
MCLKIFEDEKCEVRYVSTHIGHKNDLGRSNLGRGEPCEYPELKLDDCVLVIMNQGQAEIAKSLSDMAQAFYNAWLQVMGLPVHRLFCAWHIDRARRNNLQIVHSKEKQVAVYKKLRTLLQERDNNAFTIIINTFLMQLSNDPDTK